MRMRELKAISKHADGMSSDEEVPETDASAFRNQIGINNYINHTSSSIIFHYLYFQFYQIFIVFFFHIYRGY